MTVGRRIPHANGISTCALASNRGTASRSRRSAISHNGAIHRPSSSGLARRTMRRTASAPKASHPRKTNEIPAQSTRSVLHRGNAGSPPSGLAACSRQTEGGEALFVAPEGRCDAGDVGAGVPSSRAESVNEVVAATKLLETSGRIASGTGVQSESAGKSRMATSVASQTRWREPAEARRSIVVAARAARRRAVALSSHMISAGWDSANRIARIVTSRSIARCEFARAAVGFLRRSVRRRRCAGGP